MGIYYSSVGTRLVNYLKLEGLTLEDFTVLSPDMTMYIKNLGKKSRVAVEDWLEENNLQAGKWDGREKGMTWYKALDYYKEHRDELRKAYPPKPIEQAEEDYKPHIVKDSGEVKILLSPKALWISETVVKLIAEIPFEYVGSGVGGQVMEAKHIYAARIAKEMADVIFGDD